MRWRRRDTTINPVRRWLGAGFVSRRTAEASLAECSPPPDYVGVAAMLPDSTIVVEVMFQGCLDGEDVVGHDMRDVRPEDPF